MNPLRLVIAIVILGGACAGVAAQRASKTKPAQKPVIEVPPPPPPRPQPTEAQIRDWHCEAPLFDLGSPTQAYKSIYFAVKCKDNEKIKLAMSKSTIEFMEAAATLQKKTFDEVIVHGLTESTFAPALPELCEERVKETMGAVEVKRLDGKWEDLPFIFEDGQWKMAVGDLFKETYQKPSDPQCTVPEAPPKPKKGLFSAPKK